MPKDLVGDLAGWQARLAEVLAHANGHPRNSSVQYDWKTLLTRATSWEEVLKRAGEEPLFRTLGAEVVEQVSDRARGRGFGRIPQGGQPPLATPEQVARVYASYLDQVWCLLGSHATQACAERLAKALKPGGDSSLRNGTA